MAQSATSANRIFAPTTAGSVGHFGTGPKDWLRRLWTWRERRRRYWRTVKELSALSDHVLADIGVHRGEIHARAARLYRLPVR